ncbi:MAG: tRNA (adenosine(37)-N6)-threonylcarbamoyltransferase complex dimerization subunit type 1 TsaB [Planctomycetota bacterium]
MTDPRPADQPHVTLAIEMSNPSAADERSGPGVALARVHHDASVEVLGEERLAGPRRPDADLLPAIERLVVRAGLTPRSLDRVAVGLGPGGYTSIRIAAAAGQAIAFATGAAAVPVPSAMIAAVAAIDSEPANEAFLVGLASKRGTAWITPFRADGTMGAGELASADRLVELADASGARRLLIDRFAPEAMLTAAARCGLEVHPPRLTAAHAIHASVLLPDAAPGALRPIYPREPEAVTRWRERGRDG